MGYYFYSRGEILGYKGIYVGGDDVQAGLAKTAYH
jgi:hypothetical protein